MRDFKVSGLGEGVGGRRGGGGMPGEKVTLTLMGQSQTEQLTLTSYIILFLASQKRLVGVLVIGGVKAVLNRDKL